MRKKGYIKSVAVEFGQFEKKQALSTQTTAPSLGISTQLQSNQLTTTYIYNLQLQTQWLPRRSSLFSPPTTRLTPLTDPLAGTWYVSIFPSTPLLLLSNPNFQLVTSSDLINHSPSSPTLTMSSLARTSRSPSSLPRAASPLSIPPPSSSPRRTPSPSASSTTTSPCGRTPCP